MSLLTKVKSGKKGTKWLWPVATLVSLIMLGLVMIQADGEIIASMLGHLTWNALAAALVFLTLEGVFTAMRIRLFAGRKPRLSDSLKANAWYVLLLVMLPARLGEVAAVIVFERYLGQKYGAAAMSIVAQRLYDVIVLGAFFLMALLGISDFFNKTQMFFGGFVVIALAVAVLIRADFFLSQAAWAIKKSKLYKKAIFKKLMHLILQARTWNRHMMGGRDIVMALVLTVLKWAGNLGGLMLLFGAINLPLPVFEALTTAAAYNFLAIVPLQTIGGIGIGEAGLTILLGAVGMPSAVAASAAIMIRVVIIIFPFIFWAMVMGGLKAKENLGW